MVFVGLPDELFKGLLFRFCFYSCNELSIILVSELIQ